MIQIVDHLKEPEHVLVRNLERVQAALRKGEKVRIYHMGRIHGRLADLPGVEYLPLIKGMKELDAPKGRQALAPSPQDKYLPPVRNVPAIGRIFGVSVLPYRAYEDPHPGWTRFNPAYLFVDGELCINIRRSNYMFPMRMRAGLNTLGGRIVTHNDVFSKDGKFIKEIFPPIGNATFAGYEDLRICPGPKGDVYVTACDVNGVTGKEMANADEAAGISIMRMDTAEVVHRKLIHRYRPEKNWAMIEGTFDFVYGYDPFTVIRLPGMKEMHPKAGVDVSGLRGSSHFIEWDGNYLGVAHRKWKDDFTHCLILLDTDYNVIAKSPEFKFLGEKIEFCCSILKDGNNLRILFSAWDALPGEVVIPVDAVAAMLKEKLPKENSRRLDFFRESLRACDWPAAASLARRKVDAVMALHHIQMPKDVRRKVCQRLDL